MECYMNIIFVSAGSLDMQIENFFRRLKSIYPSIIRIHGLSDKFSYSIGAQAAEDDDILFINTNKHGITANISLDYLCNRYEILKKREIPIINIPYEKDNLDLLYLTYEEAIAEDEFVKLLKKYSKLKRLHHVTGLYKAINLGAQMIEHNFYVMIDGDNEVLDEFDLYNVEYPQPNQMNFYMTRNAVNDLVYGYGGIKVCPTYNFRQVTNDRIDPTASGNLQKVHGIKKIASITHFNVSPFDAWKAGFREAVMLVNQDNEFKMDQEKIKQKLTVWKTVGKDRDFGEYAMQGACDGEEYGRSNKNNKEKLYLINDPNWLAEYFNNKKYLEK